MARASDPNWLLRTLIIASVGVHVLLLLRLTDVYRTDALNFIEMSLQQIDRPPARAIPRPRPRPKTPPPQDSVKKLSVVPRPMPTFKPLDAPALDAKLPDTLVEGIGVPDIPSVPGVDASAWAMASQAPAGAEDYLTAESYLDMVRLKIESSKRYPEIAKTNSIEGRVAIHFILGADGSVRDVSVVKGARHRALNLAALDAVKNAAPFPRPPSTLFKGDLSLNLVIVFELT